MITKPETFEYNLTDLVVKKEDIYLLMGHKGGYESPVNGMIDEILEQIPPKCDIKGGYIVADEIEYHADNSEISLAGKKFQTGGIVFNMLKDSSLLVLHVCTAGKGIEEWSRQEMQSGDVLKGYLIDTVGSIVVEAAMDKIHKTIMEKYQRKGLNVSNRYSPGYCDWNVAEQQKLFSFFEKGFLGITLSDTSLMSPIKSVSGFIGVGENVKFNKYSCFICNDSKCIYNKKKIRTLE